MNPQISDFFLSCQSRVNSALEKVLEGAPTISDELLNAVSYSVLNGGKRIRPSLCYATALALKNDFEQVDSSAVAIELIHCYSLVHDDLPAMDDDDLRRGRPTCHIKYNEATAILAGDALQALAFEILAKDDLQLESSQQVKMITELAHASGLAGMAAGQALDLAYTNKSCSEDNLANIHLHKTGKLISACINLSVLACKQENSEKHQCLSAYGKALGLAFQVKDDILDIEASTEILGKSQGSDVELLKSTYPSLLGLEGAKNRAEQLHEEAISALAIFGPEADILRELSFYVINREN